MGHIAWGTLVPQTGIEPAPHAMEAQSPDHWTVREVPRVFPIMMSNGDRKVIMKKKSIETDSGTKMIGLVDKHIMIVLHLYSRYLRKYRKLEPVN